MDPTGKVTLITALVTFFSATFLYATVFVMYFVYKHLLKLRNPIDITILELTNNGIIARHARGRREFREGKGWRVVTAKNLRKIKDDLGYNISDDDMELSSMGKNRKFLLVVMKDGLTSPLKKALLNEDFTPEEKEALKKANERFKTKRSVPLTEIPKTLSLEPILQEQTRFRIDAAMDNVDINQSDEKKQARRMLLISGGVFAFTILICFILFIVFMQQAPDAALKVAAKGGEAVVNTATTAASSSPIPGLPLPG
jgi:hypothetical protein